MVTTLRYFTKKTPMTKRLIHDKGYAQSLLPQSPSTSSTTTATTILCCQHHHHNNRGPEPPPHHPYTAVTTTTIATIAVFMHHPRLAPPPPPQPSPPPPPPHSRAPARPVTAPQHAQWLPRHQGALRCAAHAQSSRCPPQCSFPPCSLSASSIL